MDYKTGSQGSWGCPESPKGRAGPEACLAAHVTTACWPWHSLVLPQPPGPAAEAPSVLSPQISHKSEDLGFPKVGAVSSPDCHQPQHWPGGPRRVSARQSQRPTFSGKAWPQNTDFSLQSPGLESIPYCIAITKALGHVFCLLLCKSADPWTRSGCRDGVGTTWPVTDAQWPIQFIFLRHDCEAAGGIWPNQIQ